MPLLNRTALWVRVAAAIVLGWACWSAQLASAGPAAELLGDLAAPTLGGTQFWSDQHFFHGWRIQQHAVSGKCRLLDGYDWQHAAGTFDECLEKLKRVRREQALPPMEGKAVVLLHGLVAPRWSMHLLGRHLRKHGHYTVFNVQYASTRLGIDDHAQSLANVLKSLEGIEEINLVGHSMGNVVIRRYLFGFGADGRRWECDPRIRRMVMIAPPNHGALAAVRLSENGLFRTVFGKAGQQLGVEWADLETRLATPKGEFGIIAGGLNNGWGFTPSQPGDDDGRITVETTRLAGANDFIVVPTIHELIANDPRVFEYTLRFLRYGYFVSADDRQPIGLESPGPIAASGGTARR